MQFVVCVKEYTAIQLEALIPTLQTKKVESKRTVSSGNAEKVYGYNSDTNDFTS